MSFADDVLVVSGLVLLFGNFCYPLHQARKVLQSVRLFKLDTNVDT